MNVMAQVVEKLNYKIWLMQKVAGSNPGVTH